MVDDSLKIISRVLSHRFCAFNVTKTEQTTHSVFSYMLIILWTCAISMILRWHSHIIYKWNSSKVTETCWADCQDCTAFDDLACSLVLSLPQSSLLFFVGTVAGLQRDSKALGTYRERSPSCRWPKKLLVSTEAYQGRETGFHTLRCCCILAVVVNINIVIIVIFLLTDIWPSDVMWWYC